MQGIRSTVGSAASRATDSLRHNVESGKQAAWNADRPSPASTAAGPTAASDSIVDAAPTWARKLRAEQAARHHRHAAMQTIKDGDRSGGAANPDLSEKD